MSHLPVISSASSARTTGYDGRERIGQGVLHPPPTLLLEVRTDNVRRLFENESGRLPTRRSWIWLFPETCFRLKHKDRTGKGRQDLPLALVDKIFCGPSIIASTFPPLRRKRGVLEGVKLHISQLDVRYIS